MLEILQATSQAHLQITLQAFQGELISDDMKPLVDRIDWGYCRKCKHSLYEDCVEYAYEASLHGVIGCEWLKIDERDTNDVLDGTVSPLTLS